MKRRFRMILTTRAFGVLLLYTDTEANMDIPTALQY